MHYIRTGWHWSRTRFLFSLFALALALTMPLSSYAKVTACRGDPIIELLLLRAQSTVDISTGAENVERIDYVYHLPITSGLPFVYDDSVLASKESVTFVYDLTSSTLRLDTIVRLKPGLAPVKVIATTTVTEKLFGHSATQSVSGLSGQVLSVSAIPSADSQRSASSK